jgi:tRNA(Ile)-lysidine synthase
MALQQAVSHFLDRLKRPCTLLVAYSGGSDSSGLLVALAEAVAAMPGSGICLVAATVDHRLRAGSTAEARAAGALCARYSVAHHILTWEGEKPLAGIQTAAREARYRLLSDLAKHVGADLIVTAHTFDDQMETLAMRRARSPGAENGISAAVLYDRQTWIMRPLLDVRRAAIRAFLAARSIGWVDDPSNDNPAFERVRVRQSLDLGSIVPPVADRSATAIAAFLMAHAVIPAGRLAVLDLAHIQQGDRTGLDALRHLAAMIGGRVHLGGRDATQLLAHVLASDAPGQVAVERVVCDRRHDRLFVVRERRGLPTLTIAAGGSAVWDGRYRVANHADVPVTISASHAGPMILPGSLPADLPGRVRQLAETTEPRLIAGPAGGLVTRPIIAQFDRFLPIRMLEIANALAFLSGLDHFPGLPTR